LQRAKTNGNKNKQLYFKEINKDTNLYKITDQINKYKCNEKNKLSKTKEKLLE